MPDGRDKESLVEVDMEGLSEKTFYTKAGKILKECPSEKLSRLVNSLCEVRNITVEAFVEGIQKYNQGIFKFEVDERHTIIGYDQPTFPYSLDNDDRAYRFEMPKVKRMVTEFLSTYNLTGPNFEETPVRVEKLWREFFSQPKPKLKTFPLRNESGLIAVKNHISWGFCPHHLLPVRYNFKIGYVPNKIVLGLSKLPRLADFSLINLPLQEDIPKVVVDYLLENLKPKGAGCIVEGEHLCMKMRGVESEQSSAVSIHLEGCLTEPAWKEEFLNA